MHIECIGKLIALNLMICVLLVADLQAPEFCFNTEVIKY